MAITAAMVKELREMTGAGMMDCKKGDTQCVSFLYTDSLLLGVYYENAVRNSGHLLDTAQVLLFPATTTRSVP